MMRLFLFFMVKFSGLSVFLDLVFDVLHVIDISTGNRVEVHVVFDLFFSIVIVEDRFISQIFVIGCISFKIHLLCPLSRFNFTLFNLFLHINFFNALVNLWLPFLALFFRVAWTVIVTLNNLRTFTFRFNSILGTFLI